MSEITTTQDAMPLLPEWTFDDFLGSGPYEYLYQHKDNKFLLQQMLSRAQIAAKQVHFPGFLKTWNAYVDSMSPRVSVMGDCVTMFSDMPEYKCGRYICDDFGVGYTNGYGEMVEVVSHPLMPTVRVKNIENGETKIKIAYKRGHNEKSDWREITVPKDQLASAQKIVGLAKYDVAVTSENAKDVVKYLSTLESLNYDSIPTQDAVSHLGWLQDGRFMPYADDITLDTMNPEFNKILSEMKPTGDEQKWMELARSVRSGASVPCRIALAAGFAAPLVKLLYKQSFFVHFWGRGGCGKTVGVMLATSIWGNPELGGLFKTFNGTKVSFEISASFCRNLPVGLDELQVMKREDRKNYDDIIYMLCENSNRNRATKNSELQTQRRWNTVMITTGEEPLVNDDSGDGAKLRTIDVNFKNIKFFGTDEKAKKAAALLQENYGHVGRKYIQFLQRKDIHETLQALAEEYTEALQGAIEGKQVNAAVTLLVADAIANMVIFKDGLSLTPDDIVEFLVRTDTPDASARCYDWLINYTRANIRRFDAPDVNSGEIWGKIGEDYIYYNPAIFKRILKKERNFSAEQFLEWASANGKLKHEKDRKTYKIGPRENRETVYAILIPRDEEKKQKEENGFVHVNPPEDIPF